MDLLETSICDPGTYFTIGDTIKDGTFVPGSAGFMSMTMGPERTCPNVMFYKTVVIRRGKRGKDRFEQVMLLAPIFKLPGVPTDFLIPDNEGRKYFVDMSIRQDPVTLAHTFNDSDGSLEFFEKEFGLNGYVGCLKSKTTFLKELDGVTKTAVHPLASKIGNAGVMQSVWPNKHSVLSMFDKNIDSMFSNQNMAHIRDEYCMSPNRTRLFADIHKVEAMLMIPRMEYHRKVETVAEAALKYIMEKLESSQGKKLKNIDDLVAATKNTMAAVKAKQEFLANLIDKRMDCIYTNRKKLNLQDDGPF